MSELKTLKDWRKEVSNLDEWKNHALQIIKCEGWLKKEAVKWAKEIEDCRVGDINNQALEFLDWGDSENFVKWIKHFFYLTEADLNQEVKDE